MRRLADIYPQVALAVKTCQLACQSSASEATM
jgi:hypothetical protein